MSISPLIMKYLRIALKYFKRNNTSVFDVKYETENILWIFETFITRNRF